MGYPVGNGYFIWLLKRAAGGDPEKMADMAKAAGLSWVAIKVTDGPYVFNNSNQAALLGPAVSALRKRGISVWGWGYIYGYLPTAEANMAARQVKDYGLDGFIIDAEGEMKNKPNQAREYMRVLRPQVKVPLAICSFRFPYYHMEFPWDAFRSCDVNMPQVYWMQAHNAGAQLQKTVSDFKKLGYTMPMVPVGAAFSEWGWTAQPAEVLEFRKTAAEMGMPGYSWWEWYEAEVRHPELWQASTDTSIAKPPTGPIALPPIKRVMTKYVDLRVRSGPGLTHSIQGYMKPNVPYEIVEESGVWGRFKTADNSQQWVHLGYTITL